MKKPRHRVIRIDPRSRAIAAIFMKADMASLRHVLKARSGEELGKEDIIVGEDHFTIMAKMQAPDGDPGFRLLGRETETVGIALLTAKGPHGGLTDIDISLDAVKRQIVWIDQCWEAPKTASAVENHAD